MQLKCAKGLVFKICKKCISGWPADAGGSDTLMKVLDKLDSECARRCELWEIQDNVKFALIWVRYSFRCAFNENY